MQHQQFDGAVSEGQRRVCPALDHIQDQIARGHKSTLRIRTNVQAMKAVHLLCRTHLEAVKMSSLPCLER